MQQISGQTDEYSPTKKIKQFHTQMKLHFNPLQWSIKNSFPIVSPRPRVKKTDFPKTKCCGFSSPFFLCDLFMDVPPYLSAKYIWKYLCEFCQRNTDPKQNCRKLGGISQLLVEDSRGLHKISEKFSRNSFFLNLYVWISIEFGTKRDEFQVKRTSIYS